MGFGVRAIKRRGLWFWDVRVQVVYDFEPKSQPLFPGTWS